jgi:hypothetical protein
MSNSTLDASENMLEQVDDDFIFSYKTGLLVFGIAAAFCGCCLCAPCIRLTYQIRRHNEENEEKMKRPELTQTILSNVCFGVCPICCFFIGSLLIAVYASNMQTILAQDYYGLMRITGTEARSILEQEAKRNIHKYVGYVEVAFGHDWACSLTTNDTDNIFGESSIYCGNVWTADLDCTFEACRTRITGSSSSCSESQNRIAEIKAATCVSEKYYPSELEGTYTPFNYTVGPSQDVDWPNAMLYGDCNKCEALFSVPNAEESKDLRKAGRAFLITGGILVGLICCVVYPMWTIRRNVRRNKNEGDGHEPYNMGPSAPTTVASPIQNGAITTYHDNIPTATHVEGLNQNGPITRYH